MKKTQFAFSLILALFSLNGMTGTSAWADDAQTNPTPSATATATPEKLPVDKMKDKYWLKGNDSELSVVQNRLYSKAHTFELGLFVGSIASDPFLDIKNYGLSLSYHISDYFGVTLLGWKDWTSSSSALSLLQSTQHTTANTNDPSNFFGGEVDFVPLYGKLSLLGKMIIYFDTHLDLGAGVTGTETGHYFTPFIGIGEQVYLNSWSSLTIDYRLAGYHETLDQKTLGQPGLGGPIGARTTLNDVITIGVSFFGHLI